MVPYEASRFRTDLAAEGANSPDAALSLSLSVGHFFWRPDSGRLFVTDSGSDQVRSYSIQDSGTVTSAGANVALASSQSYSGIAYNPTGTKLFVQYDAIIATYNMTGGYNGTAALSDTHSLGVAGTTSGLFFAPDGATLYYGRASALRQKTLSTPWDVSTAGSESVAFSGGDWHDVSRNGTRLLVSSGTTVTEYATQTPWDFGTMTVTGETITPAGASFATARYSPNGRKIVIRDRADFYTFLTVL